LGLVLCGAAGSRAYSNAKEERHDCARCDAAGLGLLGISILWTIGIIVLIIGVVFFVLGQLGHAVGGRKLWY
jgi:hypothetical protein